MATTEQIYDQAMKNRVSTAPAFTWADWTKYQTARFDDWSLWMLNASTWQLASWYYNDSVREDVKRQFMEWTYNQATTQSNIPVNQATTTPLWTSQPKTPNLYAMTQDQLQWQKSQVMQDYYSAVSWFNKQSMADELRLKTWWTVDVDKQIKTERDKLNSLLPELMQKYAHLDPNQRDTLIRQEEQWIRNSINNLEAIREYRVWTIQDILTRDIAQEEQKIRWLEMAYKMYNEVLWDQREADKLKRDIEKEALAMEKMRLELDQYKKMLPLKQREAELWLKKVEKEAWYTWNEWTPLWDYYSQFKITQNVWAKSPNTKDTWWNWWTPWIDFAMTEWTSIKAITGWKVVWAQSNKDYGTQVIIEDENWNQHMYSHLSKPNVKIWDIIQHWQDIAKSWNTWFSTWPHLDYRVKWADWKWQDPNKFLWQKWYTKTNTEISNLFDEKWKKISFDNFLSNSVDDIDIIIEENWLDWIKKIENEIKRLYPTEKDIKTYIIWLLPEEKRVMVFDKEIEKSNIQNKKNEFSKLEKLANDLSTIMYPWEKDMEYQTWIDILEKLWYEKWWLFWLDTLYDEWEANFE